MKKVLGALGVEGGGVRTSLQRLVLEDAQKGHRGLGRVVPVDGVELHVPRWRAGAVLGTVGMGRGLRVMRRWKVSIPHLLGIS